MKNDFSYLIGLKSPEITTSMLHSFEGGGANAFMDDVIPKINEFKKIYGMDYGVHDNFQFSEKDV